MPGLSDPDPEPPIPAAAKPSRPPPERFLMSDLCRLLDTYLEPAQVQCIYNAYLYGAEAHEGQKRQSGEPYIYHPIAVARILAELRMDAPTLTAAILHDVIEDTRITKEELANRYGNKIAELVDGVSKIPEIDGGSQKNLSLVDRQAANFRKMIMAMTKDIRVVVLKLADRLHNMRTLGYKKGDSKRRIARETLEIYAPIARRLGMSNLALELEELGFAALYPHRCRVIGDYIEKQAGNRREALKKAVEALRMRLREENIEATVDSREKHSYSFYKKMLEKRGGFASVQDLYGLRVIVETADTCYRTLGIVHNLYKPKPGSFKDYIALPKINGYQSLHTVMMDPSGLTFEVQIRSIDMHAYAEFGIATHGLYKTGDNSASIRRRTLEWLHGLQELQQNSGSPLEFLNNVKSDLFPEEIYVFTPNGDIIELPRGSTAVDFAYSIHSDLGHKIINARVDAELVPSLSTPLRTGQTVDVITAGWSRPKLSWLDFVVTAKARSSIRAFFKNLKHDEAVLLGKRILDKELGRYNLTVDTLGETRREHLLRTFSFDSLPDLLEDIGLGNRMAFLVARQLAPENHSENQGEALPVALNEGKPLIIKGTEGMLVNLARCCHPIPGDSIKGYVSTGRGIVVHTLTCKNAAGTRYRAENWLELEWASHPDGEFLVEIRVDVKNQRGVLATIATQIANMGVNIEDIISEQKDGFNTYLKFSMSVRDRKHLAQIMRNLRRIDIVQRIQRARQ